MRMKKLRQIIAACMTGCVLLAGCGINRDRRHTAVVKTAEVVIGSDSYEPFNYINEVVNLQAWMSSLRRRHAAASDTSRSLHRSCGRTRTNTWRKEAWIVCG